MTRRRMGLAALSGAAAALGHAPFGIWPLALAGLGALTVCVGRAPTPRGAVLAAWAGGAGYFAVTLAWIVEPFLVDVATHGWMAPFALLLMAAGLALFWALAGLLTAATGTGAIGFAVALAGAEMIRGRIFTGFPWALPAYVWADTPVRETAALWGAYGLTLVTLVLAALAAGAASERRWARLAGAVALGAALFAWAPLRDRAEGPSPGRVQLIQPNAPQSEKWDPEKAPMFVRRAIRLTAAAELPPDFVIWPETTVPYVLDRAGPVLAAASEAAAGAPLLTGINRRDAEGRWFNAAVIVGPGGQVADIYDKVHLVPFGEYVPFRSDLIRAMAAFDSYGFTPGDAVRALETPIGRAAVLICYEAIFPDHISGLAVRPDYLIQITNDAWFGTFSGPYQHLDQARFRAAEQGLPLVRAANTGVSAVIDARGRVLASLPLGTAGQLVADLPGARRPTLYAATGDGPVAGLVLVLLAGLWWRARRNPIANTGDPR